MIIEKSVITELSTSKEHINKKNTDNRPSNKNKNLINLNI